MTKHLPEEDRLVLQVKAEISSAWQNCKLAEKHGLEFGRICYEAQQKFRTVGGVGNKGKGIAATWRELNIPERTAYRWINTYLEAEGLNPINSDRDRSKTNDDIINALSKRLRGAKKAVQRVTDDWAGWKNCCPEASDELQKVIGDVGEFLTRLRLDSEPPAPSSEPDDSLIRTAQTATQQTATQQIAQITQQVATLGAAEYVPHRAILRLKRHQEVLTLRPELAGSSKKELDVAVNEMYRQRAAVRS